MIKKRLPNGLTLLYYPTTTNSVSIQINVHVGSNHEPRNIAGIAHFLEHMVFEGTTKRPSSRLIATEIESLGGDFNAYTTANRTAFYVKLLNKHFKVGLDVLSDMLQNPLFRDEDIQKQRTIIEKEIDMVNDEPRHYQWILFLKGLFKKHPLRFPTYGTKKTVKKLTRKELLDFYQKYYTPRNMTIAIVGKVNNPEKLVNQYFTFQGGKRYLPPTVKEPQQKRLVVKQKRKIANSYLVLGYKTVGRHHKDSYVLDVIDAILGKGQSGWLFDEIRTRHGLAYEVGSQHDTDKDYGYFAAFASVTKKNLDRTKKLVLEQLQKLQTVTTPDIKEAQAFIEGSFLLDNEDTHNLADTLLFWEQAGTAADLQRYLSRIKRITTADVKRVAKKYFTKDYVVAIVEGK